MVKDLVYAQRVSDLFSEVMSKTLTRKALATITELEITETQLICLRYLLLHKQTSISELADGLIISTPAATKLVDRLVKKGLIERQTDPADRRLVTLVLSEKGRQIVEEIREARLGLFSKILSRMSPSQRDGLVQGLEAFIAVGLTDKIDIEEICLKCGYEHEADCPVNVAKIQADGHPITQP